MKSEVEIKIGSCCLFKKEKKDVPFTALFWECLLLIYIAEACTLKEIAHCIAE